MLIPKLVAKLNYKELYKPYNILRKLYFEKFLQLNNKALKKILIDPKIKFLIFGSLNLIIAQIILGILLFYLPIFLATFISIFVQISLNYLTYSKYVFKSKKKSSKGNLLIYYLYSIFMWLLYSSLIYCLDKFLYLNKNTIAILVLPIFIPFTYLFQKSIISGRN